MIFAEDPQSGTLAGDGHACQEPSSNKLRERRTYKPHARCGPDCTDLLFVISEINKLMEKARQMAGDFYLFHWVDGIF